MTFSEHHSVCVMYWGEMMEKAIRPKPFFSLYPDRSRGHFTIISMVFRWMVVVIFFLLFLLLLLFILSTFPIERFWQLPNQMLILILLRLVCCRYYFFLYRFVLFAMKKRGKEREFAIIFDEFHLLHLLFVLFYYIYIYDETMVPESLRMCCKGKWGPISQFGSFEPTRQTTLNYSPIFQLATEFTITLASHQTQSLGI